MAVELAVLEGPRQPCGEPAGPPQLVFGESGD